MSFWSDASPIVKGTIVVGGICIVVALLALLKIPPFDPPMEQTQQRGVDVTQQVTTDE